MFLPPPYLTCPRCFYFHYDRMGILNHDLTVLRRINRASSTRIASHSLVELSRPAVVSVSHEKKETYQPVMSYHWRFATPDNPFNLTALLFVGILSWQHLVSTRLYGTFVVPLTPATATSHTAHACMKLYYSRPSNRPVSWISRFSHAKTHLHLLHLPVPFARSTTLSKTRDQRLD